MRMLLVPAATYERFDVDQQLPGEEYAELREYAHEAMRPYASIHEAIRIVLRMPGT